jgi:penicillin G amidase
VKSKAVAALLLLVLIAAVAALAITLAVRAPLPTHDGELVVSGLRAPVEIIRDASGVPHIYAANSYDLFFAQGYTHAQDRWWQMEFARHMSQGRLTELVGEATLASDLQVRAWGLRRVAEQELQQTDAETGAFLQAFADGVNAYLTARKPGELALAYTALSVAGMKLDVAPWTPVDTLAYGRFISFYLSANYGIEQSVPALLEAVGPEMVADFFPPYPYGEKPTILLAGDFPGPASGERQSPASATTIEPFTPDTNLLPGPSPGIGSNNWVVSGAHTASGSPLLANDPHLMIDLPSIWYEIGLHCEPFGPDCPFDVTGFTFTPFPGVALGHNQAIAWGATVAGPDVQDLYRLRVNPDDPFQYEWNGAWRDMTLLEETFAFAGGAPPQTFRFRLTHLGPVISDFVPDAATGEPGAHNDDDPLALRWTALDAEPFFRAIFGLNRATGWESFRDALRAWNFGSMNFVYADVEGNIGYQMPGRVPIRTEGHTGLTPAPGWTDAYEWQGFIPYDLLPSLYNPERGYIVTANQTIVPPAYWDYLAEELGPGYEYNFQPVWFVFGYRAERITELLLETNRHTLATFQAIQADNKLISAREMQPYLAALDLAGDERLAAARDWLLAWDCQLDAASPQAAFYGLFWKHLSANLFDDELEAHGLMPSGAFAMWPATRLLADPENAWWDDVRTGGPPETRDQILTRALVLAYEEAVSIWGSDRETWRWGDLSTVTFVSLPLGQSGIGPLERLVNRGPYPVSGGSNTVSGNGWSENPDDYFAISGLASMRMIVDLGDLTRSVSMHTTGQSGHPGSAHYDHLIPAWQQVEYHPMLWSREQVEDAAAQRLLLLPGAKSLD